MTIRGIWAWLLIAVAVLSVAINFFVAGFLFERGRQFFASGGPMTAMMLREFPPETRRRIGQELFDQRADFRQVFEALRDRRQAFIDVARAPVLDETRLNELLRDSRADVDRLLTRSQSAIVDAMKRMTPEERARIGQRAEGWGGGGWGGGGWGGGPGGGWGGGGWGGGPGGGWHHGPGSR